MFTSILVPLDGSSRAERALPVAARIARAEAGNIVLFRALPLPFTSASLFGQDDSSEWLLEEEVAGATAYLDELKASPVLCNLPISCVVKDGDPARVIHEYAEAHQVDLIVLCSHGRSNLGRWILGSVADHLARYAPMPALVARADGAPALAAPDAREAERLFCVLVPLDGCGLAEAAIEPAAHLATALAPPQPAGLHLMVIVDPFEATVRQGVPEITVDDDATSYLIRLTDRLRAEHPRVTITWSVRSEADAATGILLVAEGGEDVKGASPSSPVTGCDLIVMTTHGRTGFLRWALGSVAERVLHAAQVPVMVVRPRQDAATSATVTPQHYPGQQ
jgi:nucleotide-binding universal stress UspA family protein